MGSDADKKRVARWFAASFDRFLVFAPDGTVKDSPSPVWD